MNKIEQKRNPPTRRVKVAVLYGGISFEHEVSLMSAESVMANLDDSLFEVVPIMISKEGKFELKSLLSSDVIFPVLHGIGGEDGSIQGFCEILQKPCVGSGIEASALALDKIASKQIFENLKLPIPHFEFFEKLEWQENPSKIMRKIRLPAFIKPANTGSSIGISKVKRKSQLKRAVKKALKYDDRIIVEEALANIREIEISVLGNVDLIISLPGEIIPSEDFYTYKAKYQSDSRLIIPAEISNRKIREIQNLAAKAYRALGCQGFARVDFFLSARGGSAFGRERPEGKVYINEINTIPGFTEISMFPKLIEASGIKYKDLLTKLVRMAFK